MNLQVLISTMHQTDHSLLEKMNIQTNAVIINQCFQEGYNEFIYKDSLVKWLDSNERGLSRSRNNAINIANDSICMLADDDLVYVNDYETIIIDQFKKYPNADVIVFQVEGIERKFKNYHKNPSSINYLTSMKVSSVEVAFRLNSIKKYGVRFNEQFGAGSKYAMGEENIFLFNCLKNDLKVQYVPIKIADLYIGNSSWFNGFNEKYFIDKGAVFYEMGHRWAWLLILQFAIRKYKLYRKNYSIIEAIKLMFKGKSQYKDQF